MKSLILMFILLSSIVIAEEVQPDVSPIHPIKVYTDKGYNGGTAFFINSKQLLTAGHMFKHGQKAVVMIDGAEVPCKLIKVNFDENVDAALIEVTGYESPSSCTLSSGVFIYGFVEVDRPATQNIGTFQQLKTTNTIIPGMSGCPLLVNGVVIGMGVSNGLFTKKNNCKAIPASTLQQFLNTTGKK